jgi:hypothetical protein
MTAIGAARDPARRPPQLAIQLAAACVAGCRGACVCYRPAGGAVPGAHSAAVHASRCRLRAPPISPDGISGVAMLIGRTPEGGCAPRLALTAETTTLQPSVGHN